MRFHLETTTKAKQQAKSLKRLLRSLGYDVRLGQRQELIARKLGYANYNELHHSAGSVAGSPGDAQVGEATRAGRRTKQISILVSIGIDSGHAAIAVDSIGPTRYGPSCAADQREIEHDFEQEWGLRGSSKCPVVVVPRSRPTRSLRRLPEP